MAEAGIVCTAQRAREPLLRSFGLTEYRAAWEAMKHFTALRDSSTRCEIWLMQHPPVYTQGQAGLPIHLLHQSVIPVVEIDRGGQITYHGPGQAIAYLLLDLRRWKIKVRELVSLMEQAAIALLADYAVSATARAEAPGVYVGDAKIAALGLKIKKGCCYHGLALNVDMDLAPFSHINPCGYAGLRVTHCKEQGIACGIDSLQTRLAHYLIDGLQQHLKSTRHERHRTS